MNQIKSIFVQNRNFFICFAVFFLVGLIFLLTEGKASTFIYLNHYHASPLDDFFIYYTYLGDGLFSVAVIVILLLIKNYFRALEVLSAFLLSALLAQLLKNYFSMPRPREFFTAGQYSYFIHGVTLRGFSSFPSGHSTSIFALATLLAIFSNNKKWNVGYLIAAVAVGYSRIYLGQHFLGDVLMGSFIGVFTAILVHWLFSKKFHSFPRYT